MVLMGGDTSRGVSGLTRGRDVGHGHNSAHPDSASRAPAPSSAGASTIFAAMPFAPVFDDVFFVAIRAAADSVAARPVRVDQLMHGDDAVLATERELRQSEAVIADLSSNEPDVLYELGLAHALGKPTIQICSSEYVGLPFMVRNRETLLYQTGQIHLLADRLAVYLQRLLGRGPHGQ